MAYFPFFMDLEGKHGLIVGGGTVALRKAERLLPFGPQLTVAAPDVVPELAALPGVTVLRRPFGPDLLDGQFFVIAATDDADLNHRAADACRARGIPVNVVDDRQACSFLFPALIQEGKLTVGISTGGASPTAAIYVKRMLEQSLPENFAAILDWLETLRAPVQAQIADESERAAIFSRLFSACLQAGGPLSPDALQALLPGRADPPETGTQPGQSDTGLPEAGTTAEEAAEHGAQGRVFLVGAGCGAADLITVRGLRLLQQCDAVVYDDLIDTALLDAVPQTARRVYVGSRAGAHSRTQAQIHAILAELAGQGKTVVRLKGGDPFVFGRGGEELQALRALNIPCEVVPGITSAIAIPAEAGIPVTCRDKSRSVHILTGHTADTADGLPEDLELLAQLSGTLVILMGLGSLEKITDRLLAAGKAPDTPAAVLSGGNSAHPAAVRGTLADIAQRTRAAAVRAPAVIVIGQTAAMQLL